MNNKFLVLVAIGTAVSVGSYYALNLSAPYQKEQPIVVQGVTVDEVFAGGLETPSAETAPEAPESVPEETASDASATAVADVEAAPAVAEAEPEPEPVVAEPVAAEPPPAPAAAKPAEKKPVPEKQQPAPAAAKPAASAPKAWWGKEDPAQLSVVAATSMSASKAIALMFNGSFDNADSANVHIKVRDGKDKTVAGSWSVSSKNKRMLTFTVKGPGSYTVSVGAGLEDKTGRKFPQDKSGPVQVQ